MKMLFIKIKGFIQRMTCKLDLISNPNHTDFYTIQLIDKQCRGNKETNKYYRRPQLSFSKLKDIPAGFVIDFI